MEVMDVGEFVIRGCDGDKPVEVRPCAELNGRLGVVAYNQGGYDLTVVDFEDVIQFASRYYPELIRKHRKQP